MNPEHRNDWQLFAGILWIGLGIAHDRLSLILLGMAAFWLVLGRPRMPWRRKPRPTGDWPPPVTPHHGDDSTETLDV